MRARGYWGWDHRTNTDVGLVRAFFRGFIDRDTQDNNGTSLNLDYAFIQIGNLTVGYTDLIIEPVYLSYTTIHNFSATGMDEEAVLAQYVYSFGNGFSVGAVVFDPTAGSFGSNPRSNFLAGSGAAGTEYGGVRIPDFGAAITYDGSIGTFRLSGLVQDIRPNNPGGPAIIGSDHDIGWGVGFSGDIGVPIGTNTRIGFNGQYADGIVSFINADLPGYGADFSVTGTGSTKTTTAWSVGAGLTTALSERLTFNLSGGYSRASNSNVTGLAGFGIGTTLYDFTNSGTASTWKSVALIDASVNLQYQMTSNLVITGEGSFRNVNINSTAGTNRIKGNNAFSTLLRAQLDF
jgi:opacity protein-like surface antigen